MRDQFLILLYKYATKDFPWKNENAKYYVSSLIVRSRTILAYDVQRQKSS